MEPIKNMEPSRGRLLCGRHVALSICMARVFSITIFFFVLLLVSVRADAGYIQGNNYWLNTDATTSEQFLTCPVNRVSNSWQCVSTGYETIYFRRAGWVDNTGTWRWDYYESSSQADAVAQVRAACVAKEPWRKPEDCTISTEKDPSRTESRPYCSGYGYVYTVGACMTEGQARNEGLGSYIDDQLSKYNKIPVVSTLTLVLPQDTSGFVTVHGTDADGSVVGYAIYQQSANGTAVLDGTTLTFTPNAGWHGNTVVTYRAQDNKGAWSNPGTVNITVIPNKAPVAQAFTLKTREELPVSGKVSATDADDPAPTIFEIVAQSPNGTATLNGDTVTFQPVTDFFGTTTFTYRAQDERGGWSDPATVTVEVTERKVVLSDFIYISPTRSGSVNATGIDEVPQAGVIQLLNEGGAVVFEVPAVRNPTGANTATYGYDIRNAESGTYLLRAAVKDQLDGTDYLDYGDITIFVVKTIDVQYDPVHRLGILVVEDKGEILKTAEVHLFKGGVDRYAAAAVCADNGDLTHTCNFDLNGAPEGEFELHVILTDDFDFKFESAHGTVLIDKTPAVITSSVPTDGKVGSLADVMFNVKDLYDPNVTITSLVLTGGADDINQELTYSRDGDNVVPGHFILFPSGSGEPAYKLEIHTIDHQLNESSRTTYFTFNPELMELTVDLTAAGMDGRLPIPAVPFEFIRKSGANIIETRNIEYKSGNPLKGQHDVYASVRGSAQYPYRINGMLIQPGETLKVINSQDFETNPKLSMTLAAEVLDALEYTEVMVTIDAPGAPILVVPIMTWKGDINLISERWVYRQVVDPLNIMATPDQGVPCRTTVDSVAAAKADPISDPVCLIEWTATPDESEMSDAVTRGLRVASLVGHAVAMGEQQIAYNVYIFSGDGTKVKIGSGMQEISVVSAMNSILLSLDRENPEIYRSIEDLSLGFKQIEGPKCDFTLDAGRAINASATATPGAVNRQLTCLFEWIDMPNPLNQDKYASVPKATGTLGDLGPQLFTWRLSTFSKSGVRVTLANQDQSVDVVNPPAPTITLTNAIGDPVNNPVVVAPIDATSFGNLSIQAINSELNIRIERNGEEISFEKSKQNSFGTMQSILKQLPVPKGVPLWNKSEYKVTASYVRLPEVVGELLIDAYVSPKESIRPAIESGTNMAIDTELLPMTIVIQDIYRFRDPYDPVTMGDWDVRVIRQDSAAGDQPVTDWVHAEGGQAQFQVPIGDVPSRTVRFFAEARLNSPIEGYERTEQSLRPLFFAVLKGGEIDAGVTTQKLSGQAPFTATFKVALDDRDMYTSTGEIVWEVSSDNGASWEAFTPLDRYKFQYTKVFNKGTHLVRAMITNKYSGKKATTEQIEVIAYDKPELQVSGPEVVFVGSAQSLTASPILRVFDDATQEIKALPIDLADVTIEWSTDGGKTYTETGESITLTNNDPSRFYVWARVRANSAPSDDLAAYTITKKSVEFKAIRPPRIRVIGPAVIEIDKAYTFSVSKDMPYSKMEGVIKGFFTLPDGTKVEADQAEYTPKKEDLASGYLTTTYTAWVDGYREQGAEGSHSLRSRVWQYIWPKFAVDVRKDAAVSPANIELRVRTTNYGGTLEEPKYEWVLPTNGIEVTDARNPVTRGVLVKQPGEYQFQVTVSDARNNRTTLDVPLTIGEPLPYALGLSYMASNKDLREPVEILVRAAVTGGHPRDRVETVQWLADSQQIDGTNTYGRVTFNQGDHTIGMKITTLMGEEVMAEIPLAVAANKVPICVLTNRETIGSIMVYADCKDEDGRMRLYEWKVDGEIRTSSSTKLSVNKRTDESLPSISVVGIDDSGGRSAEVFFSGVTSTE